MKRWPVLGLVLGLAAGARADGGSNAGEFLRLGWGARAAAMGDAMTARAEGATALHYNPAELGFIGRRSIDAMYQDLFLGVAQGTLGYARPWGDRDGWGVGATYLDYGTTTRTTISVAGGVASANRVGTFDGRDLAVGVSYGHRVGTWAWGVTAKVVSSELDSVGAEAFAVDLGLAWRSRTIPLRAGVVLKNLGTDLTYDRADEDLPLLVRGGLSYELWDGKWILSTDLEWVRHEEAQVYVGTEYWLIDSLALRSGYDGRLADVDQGLTVGGGVRLRNLDVDYTYVPFGNVGNTHRVGLRYSWGAERDVAE